MESVPEKMTLLERLKGPMGEAYHWQYGPKTLKALEKRPTSSPSYWLVHLPRLSRKGESDVFMVAWLNCRIEPCSRFTDLPRFQGDYYLHVSEAWGDDVNAAHIESIDDYSEPVLEWAGTDLSTADQLMRLWVDELLAGRLDPDDAYTGDGDPVTYFNDLAARAAADPNAHLRDRLPAPPSNQPELFTEETP